MSSPATIDIGDGTWEPGRDGPWVTKTDVDQFERCPYRVFLSHRDGMRYRDFMEPTFREWLFTRGTGFEREVIAEQRVEEKESIEAAKSAPGIWRIPAVIRNQDLGIAGVPDMISVEKGRLIPIEVKSHSRLRPSDELELAFYWRLLEPIQRGRRDHHRKGYVWLATGERKLVRLQTYVFDRLDTLIGQARATKTDGTQPSLVPECYHCVLREEHFKIIHTHGEVSQIYGIGSPRRERLHQLGVGNISEMVTVDIDDLHVRWRKIDRYAPGSKELRKMQAHAKALLEAKPQAVGDGSVPDVKHSIVLDLEYETWLGRQIFVVGALVVEDGLESILYQELAESVSDERRILGILVDLVATRPTHSVVTWNGKAADLVELENAWLRLALPLKSLDSLRARHVDLLSVARDNYRFPTRSFGPNPPMDRDGRREGSGRG